MLLRQPSMSTETPGIEHVAASRGSTPVLPVMTLTPSTDVTASTRPLAPVPQPDLVLAPGLAGDVALAVMPVHGQGPPGFPVQDF